MFRFFVGEVCTLHVAGLLWMSLSFLLIIVVHVCFCRMCGLIEIMNGFHFGFLTSHCNNNWQLKSFELCATVCGCFKYSHSVLHAGFWLSVFKKNHWIFN